LQQDVSMKKGSYIFTLAIVLSVLLLIAGIELVRRSSVSTTNGVAVNTNKNFPREIEDINGEKLVIPARPKRIVSQTLLTDELLFDLTTPDRIASVTTASLDPKYSNVLEKVKASNVQVAADAEQILRLQPDLIFVASYTRAEIVELLRAAKAPIIRFTNFEKLDDIKRNIRTAGYAIGEDERTESLIEEMEESIKDIQEHIPKSGKPPRVLSYSLSGNTAGIGSSFDTITSLVGAINVASEQNLKGFPQISAEQLLAWQPDYIVIGADHDKFEETKQALLANRAVAASNAGLNGRIIVIDNRHLLSVSHHIVKAIEALADGLYQYSNK
jgi:iron complex transport system substrate-binding protein